MASNVDTRVVQMEFENQQFERNIAKSKRSLMDFKKELNFESVKAGLTDFADGLKNVDLGKMANDIGRLADRFTGLGRISEMVLTEIQGKIRGAIASISNFADSMTTAQISAGQAKYEELSKSVQTIMAATGKSETEVYSVMKRLNQYTDQTSYNFADMAQNIGKFTSVGISLEDAEKQMEGIANWAARSGAGITEASRAMYNLSQAMGTGKMSLIDWKSIENAGMATAEFKQQLIDSAVAAGTLEKTTKKAADGTTKTVYKTAKKLGKQVEVTVNNVGSTLNKGWVPAEVISSTLMKYYWDDLYYEGTEAIMKLTDEQQKAFDGMFGKDNKLDLSEWKQLEQMGVLTNDVKQKILDLAVAQGKLKKEADKDGKAIYNFVDKNGKKTAVTLETLGASLSKGWFDADFGKAVTSVNELAESSYEAAQKCTTFTDVLGAWRDMISTGWMNTFQHIFGTLSESMEFFSNVCNKVSESLDVLISTRNTILKGWENLGGRKSLFQTILGDYGEDVETGAYGLLDVINDVGKLISDGFWAMLRPFASDSVNALWDKDDGKWRLAWLSVELKKFTTGLQEGMQSIRKFFNEDVLIGNTTTTRLEMIKNVISGIAGVFIFARNVISGILTFFGKVKKQLEPSFLAIEYMFSTISTMIYQNASEDVQNNGILGFFSRLADLSTPLTSAINGLVVSIVNLIFRIVDWGNRTGVFQTIGDAISKLYSTLAKVAGPIATFVGGIFEAIADLFENGISADSLKAAGEKLAENFKTMIKGLADAVPDSLGWLRDTIYDIFGLWDPEKAAGRDNIFTRIHDFFANGISEVSKWFKNGSFKAIWETITNFFGEGFSSAGDIISSIIDWLGSWSLGDVLRNAFRIFLDVCGWAINQLKTRNIFTVIKAALGVISAVKIYEMINNASDVMDAVGDFFRNPFGALFGNGDQEKSSFVGDIVDKILDIAKAIGLVTLSLTVLSTIPVENLIKGGLALGAILTMLVLFVSKINEVSGSGFGSIANYVGITTMALSIGLLVAALLPLTLVSWEGFAKMMAGLGGILLQLVGFMWILDKALVDISTLGSFIGFAVSIGILVMTLLPLANISWAGYARMMAGLGGVLLQLVGFMWILDKALIDTSQLGSFIGFAASLAILMYALLPLASITWEGYGKMMAGLGGVLLQLVGFMWILDKALIDTNQLGSFIGFASSIAILMYALSPLANISWEGYAKMMAGLGGVLAQLLLFSLMMDHLSLKPGAINGAMIFAGSLSAMIASFGLALSMAKGMDWAAIIAFSVGLSLMMLSMGGALSSLGAIPTTVAVKGIAILSASIIAIMGTLSVMIPVLLGSIGSSITGVAGRLRLVADMLAQFTDTMAGVSEQEIDGAKNKLNKVKDILISLKDFKGLTGNVSAFSTAMWQLSSSLATAYREFTHVGDISNLSALQLLKDIQQNYSGIDSLAKMDLTSLQTNLAGLGGAMMLYAMGANQVATAYGGSGDTSVNDQAITAAVQIMSKISQAFSENGNFEIPNMPDSEDISGWGVQLAALAGALVSFEQAGAGLGEGTQKALDTLTFFKDLKGKLEETSFKENMEWLLGYVSGTELEKKESEDTDVLSAFGGHIASLGEALRNFAEATTGVDAVTGEIKPIDYTKGVEAIQSFLDIKEKLPNVGGIVSWVTGTKQDLITLGGEIESLGTSLNNFAKHVNGDGDAANKFDPESVKLATGALSQMADSVLEISLKMPRLGIVVGFFKSLFSKTYDWTAADLGTEFGTFGEGLGKLGAGLKEFTTKATGNGKVAFDPATTSTAAKAMGDMADAISKVNQKMPRTNLAISLWQKLFGAKKWTGKELGDEFGSLGDGLDKLGKGLNQFATKTNGSGYDPKSVGNATTAMDSMLTFMQTISGKLPVVGGIANVIDSILNGTEMSMKELGTQIGDLGDGLGKLGTGLNTGGWTKTQGSSAAFEAINSILDMMLKLGTIRSLPNMSSTPLAWIDDLNFIMQELTSKEYTFNGQKRENSIVDNIVTFVKQLNDGIKTIAPDTAKLNSLLVVSEIINELSNINVSADFKSIGTMIASGTAEGINAGSSGVISAAVKMAVSAYKAARIALKIESPSKMFAEIGDYAAQGMALGITSGTPGVEDASAVMGEKALDSTSAVLSSMGSLLDQDLDVDPTITPVLDLTGFNYGISAMHKSLDNNSMTIDTSAAGRYAIDSMPYRSTQEINQNGSDYSGLYARIEQAVETIDALGERIAQMKLVLDNDVVAGGVSSGVDKNIGRQMFYESRNN